ncbi:thiolase family protein [Nocardia sp. NPDC051787]|uniref:thiolase family protein n=1 Tax=Nocardia sp. NPDC051787 TaxID=3155415 RepID=UPI003424E681
MIAGPPLAIERLGEVLGLDTTWADQADAASAVVKGAMALHAGLAECVALVYGNDQRAAGTQYGGPSAVSTDKHLAYRYFAPWGLTSQGALYALMANAYMADHGLSEAELGGYVVAQRQYAELNPHAVLQRPLGLQDYLAAPTICDPLRRHDYCLINDGGVALIMTTTERAATLNARPVSVRGIGRSDQNERSTSLAPRLLDFYLPSHRKAASQVYEMAGIGPQDVGAVQIYDSFSIHVPVALDGFGFCPPGDPGALVREGALGPGRRLAVNTSGGHLAESYMQGWNLQVEAVRQARGDAGDRQVPDARHTQFISDVAGKTTSIVYAGATA